MSFLGYGLSFRHVWQEFWQVFPPPLSSSDQNRRGEEPRAKLRQSVRKREGRKERTCRSFSSLWHLALWFPWRARARVTVKPRANDILRRLFLSPGIIREQTFPSIPRADRRHDPARPAIQNLYLLLHVFAFAFVSPYIDDHPFSLLERDAAIHDESRAYHITSPHHAISNILNILIISFSTSTSSKYHYHCHQHLSPIRSFSHHRRILKYKLRSLFHSAHHH